MSLEIVQYVKNIGFKWITVCFLILMPIIFKLLVSHTAVFTTMWFSYILPYFSQAKRTSMAKYGREEHGVFSYNGIINTKASRKFNDVVIYIM